MRNAISGYNPTTETMFAVGQLVQATTTCQGMVAGQPYTVVGVHVLQRGPFGTFVGYTLQRANGGKFSVINGHLLLQAA